MASIGQELKRERELRGISLKEIADATKINLRFLRELEEDQFEILPGKFFIKGMIRSYAKYIGLDENAALNHYYETTQLQEQAKEEESKNKPQTTIPKKIKNLIYFVSALIVFIAILTLLHFILQRQGITSLEKAQPVAESLEETPLPPSSKEHIIEENEILLEISFHQETWIQVYADGELIIDGIKQPGDKAEARAKEELLIHLGNAGGLTYTLNNKKGRAFGPPGGVAKNVVITLNNIEDFLEKNLNR